MSQNKNLKHLIPSALLLLAPLAVQAGGEEEYVGSSYVGYQALPSGLAGATYRPVYVDHYAKSKCASDVTKKNLEAMDHNLNQLTQSSDFAEAKRFRAELARLQALKDAEAKAQAYFSLVDVKGDNKEEVFKFIGARDIHPYVSVLEKKTDLNPEQSARVVRMMAASIKAGLR